EITPQYWRRLCGARSGAQSLLWAGHVRTRASFRAGDQPAGSLLADSLLCGAGGHEHVRVTAHRDLAARLAAIVADRLVEGHGGQTLDDVLRQAGGAVAGHHALGGLSCWHE